MQKNHFDWIISGPCSGSIKNVITVISLSMLSSLLLGWIPFCPLLRRNVNTFILPILNVKNKANLLFKLSNRHQFLEAEFLRQESNSCQLRINYKEISKCENFMRILLLSMSLLAFGHKTSGNSCSQELCNVLPLHHNMNGNISTARLHVILNGYSPTDGGIFLKKIHNRITRSNIWDDILSMLLWFLSSHDCYLCRHLKNI